MKIKELKDIYPKLHEKALSLQTSISECPSLNYAFTWGDTPQGHEFWSELNTGNFLEAKKIAKEGGFLDLFDVTPDIPNLHYGGQISDIPTEIVRAMLREQVAQENSCNVYPFERDKSVDKRDGGFTWSKSKEEHKFWDDVIINKKYQVFYDKYPKENSDSKPTTLKPAKFKEGDLVVPVNNPPLIGNYVMHTFKPYKVYKVTIVRAYTFIDDNATHNCVSFNDYDNFLTYRGLIPEDVFRPATETDIKNWEIIQTIESKYKKGNKIIPAHISGNRSYVVLGDLTFDSFLIDVDSYNLITGVYQYIPNTARIWTDDKVWGNCHYNRVLYYQGDYAKHFIEEETPIEPSVEAPVEDFIGDYVTCYNPGLSEKVNIPKQLMNIMLQRQTEAGNRKDISVFMRYLSSGTASGGFDWISTPEGVDNWTEALSGGSFNAILEHPANIGTTVIHSESNSYTSAYIDIRQPKSGDYLSWLEKWESTSSKEKPTTRNAFRKLKRKFKFN